MTDQQTYSVTPELLGLHLEHASAVYGMPPEAIIQIPWRPEVVADKERDVLKNFSADIDSNAFKVAMEKAKYAKVFEREHSLITNRLSGTAVKILENADKLASQTEVYDQAQIWNMIGALALAAKVLPQIPEDHRNNARFNSDSGYYWGGFFHRFEEQAKMSEYELSIEEVIKQYPYNTDVDFTQHGPWGVPPEIWWNLKPGSTIKHAQWVIDNCPEVSLEEIIYNFALQDEHITQLNLTNKEE